MIAKFSLCELVMIGQLSTLEVTLLTPQGAYLDAKQYGDVLLPKRQVPQDCEVGDQLQVVLYADAAERIVASTNHPLVLKNQCAFLQVKQINKLGAFLHWGMPKDLLLPHSEQPKFVQLGRHYVVYVYQDKHSERLVASTRLNKFINNETANYKNGQAVEVLIAQSTDLGFKAVINHQHWGLIYHNELAAPLKIGQTLQAYIKRTREDGAIDLMLTPAGKAKVNQFEQKLLDYLYDHNGFCALHDKSSPEQIQQTFGVSKKAFKATVGHLLKRKKIKLVEQGIELVK